MKRIPKKITSSEIEELRTLAECTHKSPDTILQITSEGKITYANPASRHFLKAIKPKKGGSLKGHKLWKYIELALSQRKVTHCEFETGAHAYKLKLIPQKRKGFVYLYGVDITAAKEALLKLDRLLRFDLLTNLPNRTHFEEVLKRVVAQSKRGALSTLTLFLFDIDNFKLINDSLGHVAGDLLLQQLARKISKVIRATDLLARIGGDEFIVMSAGNKTVEKYAARLLEVAREPFVIHRKTVHITVSIGIACYPISGRSPSTLKKNADIALYMAKEKGKNNFSVHSRSQNKIYSERLKLETHIRTALKQSKFFLVYQPQYDLQTEEICGIEALLRLREPKSGVILPIKFIPIVEKMGLMAPVGEFVLKTACKQYVEWKKKLHITFPLAVNVSPFQFSDLFVKTVEKILAKTEMNPDDLVLEITESAIMTSFDVKEVLKKISELGVHIAIDDFGIGESSLSRLKDFPIDRLKVDKAFISKLPSNKDHLAIIKSIIDLSESLGISVIAEGVETKSQANILQKNKCPSAQGFYFSEPLAPATMGRLLKNGSSS